MKRDQMIDVMARAIYETARHDLPKHVMPWKDAVEWLDLEPNSAPGRDVRDCRRKATAALRALEARGWRHKDDPRELICPECYRRYQMGVVPVVEF